MTLFSLRTIYLLLYLIISSQGMFYLLCLTRALQNISIAAFVEQRKAVDAVISGPLKILYPVTIILAIAILLITYRTPKSWVFITALVSTLFLMTDISLAIMESVPLNQLINQFTGSEDAFRWKLPEPDGYK